MLLFSFFLYAVNQPEPFLILGLRTRDGPVDCGAGTGLGVRLPFTRNLSISPVLRLSPFLKTALVRGRQERRCTLSRSASWVVPQAPLLFLSPVSFLFSSQTSKMRNNFSKLRASPGTFLLDANACLRDPPHCTARLSHDTAPLRFSFHTWGSQTAATSEPIEELFSLSRNAPKGLVSVFPPPPSARPDGGCFRHQEKMGGVAGCRLGASPAARYRVPTYASGLPEPQKTRRTFSSQLFSELSTGTTPAGAVSSAAGMLGRPRLHAGSSSRLAESLGLSSFPRSSYCVARSPLHQANSSVLCKRGFPLPGALSPAGGACLLSSVACVHAAAAASVADGALATSPQTHISGSFSLASSSSASLPAHASLPVSSGCSSCSSPCRPRRPSDPTAPQESETLEMDRGLEKQRPLVTERMNERMEKQGYKIVGTHSAVKLCRWTKKQLQGVGGCYKHTFYGIESHRCMEATTSIACSNRCIFCWRHHTHPASKTFSWQVDPPEWVLQHALDAHWSLIKPLRGVHGVTPEAFAEAKEPRHCALSLIGEALMYPRINEFVDLLHAKRISSFLVMNGQHPDLLADLTTVTQLYVSVDAPNKKDLKAIDRPLFKDYWERLLASLEILREKRERTVLRMTLIKSVNDDDLEGYARLVELGQPNFIEIKGVTFAGHSPQFNLTLSHTPHMQETVEFSQRLLKVLNARGAGTARVEQSESCEDVAPMYRLASIHEHTNAVLLADARLFLLPANAQAGIAPNRESSSLSPSERSGRSDGSGEDSAGMELQNNLLARDGGRGSSGPGGLQESRESLQWYTHIDFEKFFALSTEERHAQNYRKATPSWALPDSPLRGFDPRFDVDKYVKQIAGRPHSLPAVGEQGSAFSH
uniref:tRNA wybutosine-synthesizing protein n=1 Tax=Neospora caninum (strain Liverpool) TaxID=572307 RepID=A0A0F7UMF2_NEOCL|nr:TPA: tRNA wybutosine-synthesizing protein [Neospora caninum Liverpool]